MMKEGNVTVMISGNPLYLCEVKSEEVLGLTGSKIR